MRDLVRDWRRWTSLERAAAAIILALAVAIPPAMLAIAAHS